MTKLEEPNVSDMPQDYFAMTDEENIVPLGMCDDINAAFEREPANTHWVFSRASLTALYEKIGKELS